jgi:peptidoglycan/LPS O-acetylase OafA/YrhL
MNRRVPELDGIRGLAILMILVFHHLWNTLDRSTWPAVFDVIQFGWTGVDLFFVLSGFLIGGILIDNRSSPTYFKAFYFRRLCRIVPLYFAVLVAFFALRALVSSPWLFDHTLPSWSYFLFAQNLLMRGSSINYGLGVTWSLAIEEQFYLTLPLIVWLTPRRVLPWLTVGAIFGAIATRYLLFTSGNETGAYVMMPSRADALMLGVLAAQAVRNEHFRFWVRREREVMQFCLLILFVGVVALTYKGNLQAVTALYVGSYTWFALLYVVVLVEAVSNGWIGAVFRWRWIRYCGTISYCLYLIHLPVLGLCHKLFFNSIPHSNSVATTAVTLFALGLTFTISHLSWRFFEKPVVERGQRVRYALRDTPATPRRSVTEPASSAT